MNESEALFEIGQVAGILIICYAVYYFYKKRKAKPASPDQKPQEK